MNFEYTSENSVTEKPTESPSEKRYLAVSRSLAVLLEEVHALEVPETTLENWRKLGRIMYILDDVIDSAEPEAQEKIVQFLKDQVQESASSPESIYEKQESLTKASEILEEILQNMDEENKAFLQRLVVMLLDVTLAIKEKTDTREVVRLTRLEGQISAKLFIALLPVSFRQDEKYQEMTNLISRIGRIGNTYDTAIDLPGDFQAKQIKVTPTPLHRAAFIGAALADGMGILKKGILTPKTLKIFLKAFTEVTKDKE